MTRLHFFGGPPSQHAAGARLAKVCKVCRSTPISHAGGPPARLGRRPRGHPRCTCPRGRGCTRGKRPPLRKPRPGADRRPRRPRVPRAFGAPAGGKPRVRGPHTCMCGAARSRRGNLNPACAGAPFRPFRPRLQWHALHEQRPPHTHTKRTRTRSTSTARTATARTTTRRCPSSYRAPRAAACGTWTAAATTTSCPPTHASTRGTATQRYQLILVGAQRLTARPHWFACVLCVCVGGCNGRTAC